MTPKVFLRPLHVYCGACVSKCIHMSTCTQTRDHTDTLGLELNVPKLVKSTYKTKQLWQLWWMVTKRRTPSQTKNKTKLLALSFNVPLEIKASTITNNLFLKRTWKQEDHIQLEIKMTLSSNNFIFCMEDPKSSIESAMNQGHRI